MKIAIIFAMESEKVGFTSINPELEKKVDLYVCGIGKVNASSFLTKILENHKYDLIINCGVAGGFNGVQTHEVFIGSEFTYSDFDLREFNYQIGQVPSFPATYKISKEIRNNLLALDLKYAKILTQDHFAKVSDLKLFKEYFSDYKIVDMESTALAQVSEIYNQNLLVIRGISDELTSDEQTKKYQVNLKKTAENVAVVTKLIVERLLENEVS